MFTPKLILSIPLWEVARSASGNCLRHLCRLPFAYLVPRYHASILIFAFTISRQSFDLGEPPASAPGSNFV